MIFSGLNSRTIRVQSCRICARQLGALLIGMLTLLCLAPRYARTYAWAVVARGDYTHLVLVQHHDCPPTCARTASAWGSQKVMSMARYNAMAADRAAWACSPRPVWPYSRPTRGGSGPRAGACPVP